MRSRVAQAAICFLGCWLSFEAAAAEFHGRVIEQHSGAPVEQAQVSLERLSQEGRNRRGETGKEGEFLVPRMADGRYRVEVSKPGYATSALFLRLEGDTSVVVRLAKGGVISGTITSKGGAVRDAWVFPLVKTPGASTLRRLSGASNGMQRVDDRGHYRLHGLPPGDYAVGVSYSGAGTTSGSGAAIISDNRAPRLLSIASGEEYENISLTMTPGPAYSIEGHIEPIEGGGAVLVTLTLQDQPGIAVAQALTDTTGRFRFEQIQKGSYHLLAAGPSDARLNGGFAGLLGKDPVFGRIQVNVTYRDEKGLSIRMQPERTIAFRLGGADPASKGTACGTRAALGLTTIDEWGAKIDRRVAVNVESDTTISGVAPARYWVTLNGLPDSCYYSGDPVLDLTATAPETVMLPLAPGASVEGKLITAGHANPAGYIVLLWPDTPADGEPARLIAVPNAEGLFFVESLRPGNYRFATASLPEWSGPHWKSDASRMVPMPLTPGVTTVELPLPGSL